MFGDDLPKQVKDLTEVNRVGKKVTTVRHPPGLILILGTLQVVDKDTIRPRGLFGLVLPQPANKPPEPKEDKARKVEVDNKSLDVSNIAV